MFETGREKEKLTSVHSWHINHGSEMSYPPKLTPRILVMPGSFVHRLPSCS